MATITCYGGVNQIGGNKIFVELDGTSLFLDFGFAFGDEAQFYEEYLQPRSNSKLHDLLTLDLLPEIDGIYREDALQPIGLDSLESDSATQLWERNLQSYEAAEEANDWTLDAVLLSHAHLDHAGYIPYLGNVSIYCTETTETVLEAITEVGNLQGFDSDLLEINRREIDHYQGGYFPGSAKSVLHKAPSLVDGVT